MTDRVPDRPDAADLRDLVCLALRRVRGDLFDDDPGRTDGGPRDLVTVADVESAAGGSALKLAPNAVVTPAARDRARELGVDLATAAPGTDAVALRPAEEALADRLAVQLSRQLSGQQLEELACWCRTDCLVREPERVELIVEAGADRVGISTATPPLGDAIAPLIDHTLLKPEATESDVRGLCREAVDYGFAAVCINPYYVPLVADLIGGARVKVCTVVGFPLGANMTETKVTEALRAVDDGAEELDMVINVGALKSGRDDWVRHDIARVVDAGHSGGATVKVILETALLTDAEKMRGCRIARDAGADYVKTSTGFGPGGATTDDVALMRRAVGREMGVKASGGIGTREEAAEMIAAGATRIGASAGVRITEGG